jgi:N utilization substance protein A
MNTDILEALGAITREKNVERSVLVETLEAGLVSAGKKKFGATANIEVKFDNIDGGIEMARVFDIVELVEDPLAQVTLEEAQKTHPDATAGGQIRFPLAIEDFGRNAIQAAKQVLIQRVREAERDRVFQEYSTRMGQLVRGIVQQVDRGNVIVKLERAEGMLPSREQIPRDHHRQGDYVRAVVLDVDKMAKGPQVILSRTHPDFLRRLFEAEVPEIADRIVEIKAVAREAGARSKISVYSKDPRVDAVGSCVGLKGSRVQSIVRELGGERIDIVPWSADPAVFVSRALSPAKVLDVRVQEEENRMQVVVADDQLSLAIGKGGQNARLAAKLTGWRIDLISRSEDVKRQASEKAARIDIEIVEGLGPRLKETLVQAGIESVQELLDKPLEELLALPGIGEKTAEKALAVARYALARHQAEQAAATEVTITPEMEKDEAAEAVAPIEHPAEAVAAAPVELGPAPEAVEIEEQYDPDVVPPHLGTPPAADADAEAAAPADEPATGEAPAQDERKAEEEGA